MSGLQVVPSVNEKEEGPIPGKVRHAKNVALLQVERNELYSLIL